MTYASAAELGVYFSNFFRVKFIFAMAGLWSDSKAIKDKPEACEMWFLRRMGKSTENEVALKKRENIKSSEHNKSKEVET